MNEDLTPWIQNFIFNLILSSGQTIQNLVCRIINNGRILKVSNLLEEFQNVYHSRLCERENKGGSHTLASEVMTCCRTWTSLSTSCFMSLQESVECRQTLSHIEILCRPVSEPAGHQVSRDTHKHTPPPALEDHRPGHGKASSLQSYRWDFEIIFHSHLLYQWLAKHTWTWTTYTLLSCNYSWTGEPCLPRGLVFSQVCFKKS